MRQGYAVALLVGCGSPAGPPDAAVPDATPPVLRRGPDRSTSPGGPLAPERRCDYTYDADDRLIQLVVDEERDPDPTLTYEWEGDVLVSIERTIATETGFFAQVWAMDGDGSTLTSTPYVDGAPTSSAQSTYSAPVALPRVLACDPLADLRVYMANVHPWARALPDQVLTTPDATPAYTGVEAGQPGTRFQSWPPDPDFPDLPRTIEFTYDQRGRVVAQYDSNLADGDYFRTLHTYFEDDRFAENRYEHDDLTWIETYSYDAAGNLLEISSLLVNEVPPVVETYEYDD